MKLKTGMEDQHIVGFGDSTEQKGIKQKSKKKSGGFQSLGLCFPVLKGLQKRGYKIPTPIQRKCIPIILEGRDVVAMARTGSGKTACFLVPMFERLKDHKLNSGPRALVLSPTRELALQTYRFVKELGRFTNCKATTVLGGDSMDQQFGAIHGNPDVLVATPGRFLHLCVEMDLKLNSIEYVVFDEADRLFEMGLGDQLQDIIDRLPEGRQTLLFSATLPKLLVDFAKVGLNDPVLLRLDVESKIPDTLELAFFSVRSQDKPAALLALLRVLPAAAQTIVFAATKHHVEFLHLILDKAGISNTFIYSDLDPSARKINAAKFENKNCAVLVVTDIAARGVDIPHLDYVINYHFPAKSKLFVHRVGRCARAGRSGTAFSFISTEESAYVLDLHLFLGRPLRILSSAQEKDDSQENTLGSIPDELIESGQSEILSWLENNVDLNNMTKVCANAYRRYLVSRPGASVESVRRLKEINLADIRTHPFFKEHVTGEVQMTDLLCQMKKYKPKGTVFELNISAKSKSYAVMKVTKKAHEKQIQNFKNKRLAREEVAKENVAKDAEEPGKWVKLKASSENDIKETFTSVIGGKRKRNESLNEGGKRKKANFKDEEFYVPHIAPDRHTEAGLAVDNFTQQANRAAFDITGDSAEGLRAQKKLKKWDAVKKKMVGPQNDKVKKIKTESGNWIASTYKSNRYAQWKEKERITEQEESEGSDDNSQPMAKNSTNTRWGRHNQKVAEKIKSKGKMKMKSPEQILKARKIQQNRQRKSIPKDKKRKYQQVERNRKQQQMFQQRKRNKR